MNHIFVGFAKGVEPLNHNFTDSGDSAHTCYFRVKALGDNNDGEWSDWVVVNVTSDFRKVDAVTIKSPGTLCVGDSKTLSATIYPSAASVKELFWQITSGSSYASIDPDTGKLTCLAEGTIQVKASARDGKGAYGTRSITIYEGEDNTNPVTSITLDQSSFSMKTGETKTLTATVKPAKADNKTLKWNVRNGTGNATINSSGVLTALTAGKVYVSASSTDGSGVTSSEITVTITQAATPVEQVQISGGNFSTAVSSGGKQLTASVYPATASNQKLTWSVTNGTGTASINASTGYFTPLTAGTVTVKASSTDGSGKSGSITVTILPSTIPAQIITISPASLSVASDQTETSSIALSASKEPAGSVESITWSSNNSIVSVIDQGNGTAFITTGTVSKPTSAVVTASAGTASKQATVTVYDRPVIKQGSTAISRESIYNYDISKGDLKLTWSVYNSSSSFVVNAILMNAAPNFKSTSDTGTSLNNYIADDKKSITIPASQLAAGKYIKIGVQGYGVSWSVIGVRLVNNSTPATNPWDDPIEPWDIATSGFDPLTDQAIKIIRASESDSSGKYQAIGDKGQSVGILQWYNTRGMNVVRRAIYKDPQTAYNKLGAALYAVIENSSNDSIALSSSQITVMKTFLATSQSKTAQDEQAKSDVSGYLKTGRSLGITDAEALIEFADIANLGMGYAKTAAKAAKDEKGSYGAIDLYTLNQKAHSSSSIGDIKGYKDRHDDAYKNIKALGLSTSNTCTLILNQYTWNPAGTESSKAFTVTCEGSYSYAITHDIPSDRDEETYNCEWLTLTKTATGFTLHARANYATSTRTAAVNIICNSGALNFLG